MKTAHPHFFLLIRLNNNDLTGPIDLLAGLENLKFLDLSSNEMTGSLMDANNLTKLESFKVNGNKFSGSVPKSFSNMSSLGMFPICFRGGMISRGPFLKLS